MARLGAFTYGVRMDAISRQLRTLRGRFIEGVGAAGRAHADAAFEVAREMEDVLVEKMAANRHPMRTRRATRHLRKALVSEGNWAPIAGTNWLFGFKVGIPEHLDSTPAAPYWRNLEEGTDLFLGRELRLLGPDRAGQTGLRDLSGTRRARSPRGRFRPVSVVTVESPIPAYKYLAGGAARGIAKLQIGRVDGRMAVLYRLNGVPGFTSRAR